MLKNAAQFKFEGTSELGRAVTEKQLRKELARSNQIYISDFQGAHETMPKYNDHYHSHEIAKELITGESSSNLNWLSNLRTYSNSKKRQSTRN